SGGVGGGRDQAADPKRMRRSGRALRVLSSPPYRGGVMSWKREVLGILAALSVAASAAAAAPSNPPLGVRADTSVPGQVTLTWLPVTGATSYKIYRKVDPLIQLVAIPPNPPQWLFIVPVSAVATVTDATYTDTGLPPLVRQFYVVTAANDDGESPLGLLATPL